MNMKKDKSKHQKRGPHLEILNEFDGSFEFELRGAELVTDAPECLSKISSPLKFLYNVYLQVEHDHSGEVEVDLESTSFSLEHGNVEEELSVEEFEELRAFFDESRIDEIDPYFLEGLIETAKDSAIESARFRDGELTSEDVRDLEDE